MPSNQLKLRVTPYLLEMKHPFGISTNTRMTTPIVLTELEWNGVIGYGEAAMPPYLGESQASAVRFLSQLRMRQFNDPFQMEDILAYTDRQEGNLAAKTAVDIALHDLVGKLINQPWYKIWGYNASVTPYTSYTIGIDTPEMIQQKVKLAAGFRTLKIKLGRDTDRQMIEVIRQISDVPLYVDVNQGWTDKNHALDMIYWLHERGVQLVEQPMPKEQMDDMAWLTERSPIPTIADESVQRLSDIPAALGVFHGINIKLMKCTGMREAHKMIDMARALGLKVMIGCMTETSCAISAAAHLSPVVDWADLDGALLIKNDIFDGMKIEQGKIVLNDTPGLGIKKIG